MADSRSIQTEIAATRRTNNNSPTPQPYIAEDPASLSSASSTEIINLRLAYNKSPLVAIPEGERLIIHIDPVEVKTTAAPITHKTITYQDPYLFDPSTLESKSTEIGHGTHAIITQTSWKQTEVAIKQINYKLKKPEKCQFEKDILVQLTNANADNVLPTHGYFFTSATYSLVMDYLPTGTISSYIAQHKPLPWRNRLVILRDITRAIASIHRNGIIHGNIKGSHFLLTKELRAQLIGFGSASRKEAPEYAGGTAKWMAPELFDYNDNNLVNTTKTDVYSLAVTCFEIAAWKLPYTFLEDRLLLPLVNHVTAGHRDEMPETTPAEVAALIKLGWAADKNVRPSAQKLLDSFEKNDADALPQDTVYKL
jgi:serine/threonine protein kinase